MKTCALSSRAGVVVSDVIYLAVTVIVFAAVWLALRGVEKL
ncbi:hypothetical protein OHB24_09350 [Kribbella sp. NBC_00482]